MGTNARQRLLAAAADLFYAEGVRAVGIERLLSESGVGRASFYRHFQSKDDLVVAMIRHYGDQWLRWLEQEVRARGGGPLAVFDALTDRFESPAFRGCAAINTMIEMPDRGSPAHQAAADHKRAVTDYLDRLLEAAGHPDHRRLAGQLMLLIDGATVTAVREHNAQPARHAKAIAATLLRRSP